MRAYEQNLSKTPYDVIAKCGKADILKELGEFEESLKVYDEVISEKKTKKNLQHAKASILITLGRYTEAKALLDYDNQLQTVDDWMAYHVNAVLLMKNNEIDRAITLLENGLRNCPFFKSRKYFQNSLAIAMLRIKDFKNAIAILENNTDPMANILSFHSWGEIIKKDKSHLSKINN